MHPREPHIARLKKYFFNDIKRISLFLNMQACIHWSKNTTHILTLSFQGVRLFEVELTSEKQLSQLSFKFPIEAIIHIYCCRLTAVIQMCFSRHQNPDEIGLPHRQPVPNESGFFKFLVS